MPDPSLPSNGSHFNGHDVSDNEDTYSHMELFTKLSQEVFEAINAQDLGHLLDGDEDGYFLAVTVSLPRMGGMDGGADGDKRLCTYE